MAKHDCRTTSEEPIRETMTMVIPNRCIAIVQATFSIS